jgi:saccharopine dehydrogenase-like NADP-dependent oxidoreductase
MNSKSKAYMLRCTQRWQGYKFSWSPRGVLVAGLNAARYRENGNVRSRTKYIVT